VPHVMQLFVRVVRALERRHVCGLQCGVGWLAAGAHQYCCADASFPPVPPQCLKGPSDLHLKVVGGALRCVSVAVERASGWLARRTLDVSTRCWFVACAHTSCSIH
jgi:hypothetical protein